MNRVETSLPQRLGSIAWRYQTALGRWSAVPVGAWQINAEAEEDAPVGDGPTARTERLARVEAVLFLAKEPLATRKLAELADLADGTEARTLVQKLNRLYDKEGCAFRAVEVAGGFQLLSRPQFASYLRRLHGPAVEVRLSAPAMETLAVVAYRQPVLRTTIEAIRGVQCGELLRQLMERDLVRIAGRSEELGRPFLYGTTKRFLQVFGLRHLDELPPVEAELPLVDLPEVAAMSQPQVGGRRQSARESDESPLTEEESTVKIEIEGREIMHPVEELSTLLASEPILQAEFEDDTSFDDEEEEYEYDDDDEDEDEDEEEDEADADEDIEDDLEDDIEEDDDFEDPEWEEVEDDDEEEDDDWDDDDDDDDDDWGDEEAEEEEEEEDWA